MILSKNTSTKSGERGKNVKTRKRFKNLQKRRRRIGCAEKRQRRIRRKRNRFHSRRLGLRKIHTAEHNRRTVRQHGRRTDYKRHFHCRLQSDGLGLLPQQLHWFYFPKLLPYPSAERARKRGTDLVACGNVERGKEEKGACGA